VPDLCARMQAVVTGKWVGWIPEFPTALLAESARVKALVRPDAVSMPGIWFSHNPRKSDGSRYVLHTDPLERTIRRRLRWSLKCTGRSDCLQKVNASDLKGEVRCGKDLETGRQSLVLHWS
jgi:hypothetical protein